MKRPLRQAMGPDSAPPKSTEAARAVRRLIAALLILLASELVLFALDTLFPPDMARAQRSSPVAMDRHGQWLRALPVEDGRWRVRADLDRIDPTFIKRLIALEDERYWLHPGVDPIAVLRAAISDLRAGGVVSGGSTLSMQVARRLEPRERTFQAKAIEAIRAIQIEMRLSKRELLSLYLTLAPYGGNIEGVRAASLAWFGHEPTALTDAEQALLIALPQSPEVRRPDRRPEAARAARDAVVTKLHVQGLIESARAQEAKAESLGVTRTRFPSLAWHISGELARSAPALQASVPTTLDAALQTRLEPLAAAVAAAQGPQSSAAILVVEVRSRAVRAAVGSAGLDRSAGWVDMTRALRSPGSALKPFIYAMAFDQGLAAPDTRMRDEATRFAGYQPENFDRTFHDQVTVREALAYSLNVPAVATLARVGPAAFEARLSGAGVSLVRPRAAIADPGLALALGGAGVTLRDLAVLYAALADDGVAKPLAWTRDEAARIETARGRRLVSKAAADDVLAILRESPSPPGRAPAALTQGGPGLAFKTGTSYGFRDAVAAGVGGGYVVVVWTGRPDGGARQGGLTGREAALPLMFDVFDALAPRTAAPPPIGPRRAPAAIHDFTPTDVGPALIFPPDGATVQVDQLGPQGRGLALAARGDGLRWYVDGRPLAPAPSGGVFWRPDAAGFYSVSVVDAQGRTAKAKVRIRN